MIKINLLPPEMLAERERKASQAKVMKVVVLALTAMLLVFAAQLFFTMQITGSLKAVDAQREALEAQAEVYQRAVELQNRVNTKKELLVKAMDAPLLWRDTLGSLGVHIPDNVWLTNVSVSRKEGVAELVLRGETYDHPATAAWVSQLAAVGGVTDVRAVFSSEEDVEQEIRVRFEIRASVAPDTEYDPLQGRGE